MAFFRSCGVSSAKAWATCRAVRIGQPPLVIATGNHRRAVQSRAVPPAQRQDSQARAACQLARELLLCQRRDMDPDGIGVELYAEEGPAIWKTTLQAVAEGEAVGDLTPLCPQALLHLGLTNRDRPMACLTPSREPLRLPQDERHLCRVLQGQPTGSDHCRGEGFTRGRSRRDHRHGAGQSGMTIYELKSDLRSACCRASSAGQPASHKRAGPSGSSSPKGRLCHAWRDGFSSQPLLRIQALSPAGAWRKVKRSRTVRITPTNRIRPRTQVTANQNRICAWAVMYPRPMTRSM